MEDFYGLYAEPEPIQNQHPGEYLDQLPEFSKKSQSQKSPTLDKVELYD